MANICESHVSISGPASAVDSILENYFEEDASAKGNKVFSLHKVCPPPSADEECRFYEKKWGFRWFNPGPGVNVSTNDDGTKKISFWVDTPWGPPRDFLVDFSAMNPAVEIEAEYEEPSLDEAGLFVAKAGEVLCDE